MKNSTIGVFLNLGESFTSLGGQAELMLQQNILPYSQSFDQVYIFTYASEKIKLPSNCHLVISPLKLHRYFYALLLPLIHQRIIRQCDLLRCFQLSGALPAIIARLLYGTRFVFNYGYDYAAFARIEGKPLPALGFKLLAPVVFKLAVGVIFKNKSLLLTMNHALRAIYLPNGVDIKLFKPKPKKFSKIPIVLYVGRLEPQKNLTTLLLAISQLPRPLKLVLVGQGSQKQKLIRQAKNLSLNLIIKDQINHREIPRIYQSADIFVLPSLIEGSPKVLLEAMACGLPIVASNVIGIKEIIKSQVTGVLVEPTVTGLSSGINYVLSHPLSAQRIGASARREATKHYSQDTIIKSEIEFLKICSS